MILLPTLLLLAVPQQSLSYQDLLASFTDPKLLAAAPVPGVRAYQFSSYDRKSEAGPDDPEAWFANDDRGNYLRSEDGEGGKEHVMAEVDGPVVITRIWSANPSGELRFYAKGSADPVLSVPFQDLVSGGSPAFGAPLCGIRAKGANCYVPLPFADGFKLTSTAGDLFYHVNVRAYPAGTVLPALSAELLDSNRENIASVNGLLERREFLADLRQQTTQTGRLMPGQFMESHIRRAGTVQLLKVELMQTSKLEDLPRLLRDVRLQFLADRSEAPQVDVPLGDFFGAVPEPRVADGYLISVERGSDGWIFTSRIPIPYSRSLRIRLLNESLEQPFLRVRAEFDTADPPPLRLHAAWKQEQAIPTRPFRDYRLLDAQGPGRFLGCSLLVRNPSRKWWGEGDEKIFLDGEEFPSTFGTGTEDYFGYAWCSPDLFVHPFHAQLRCDGPDNFGYTLLQRFQLSDAIPFQESMVFDLELWHWDEEQELDVASVAWWYAPLEAENAMPPLPDPDQREIRPLPAVPAAEGS